MRRFGPAVWAGVALAVVVAVVLGAVLIFGGGNETARPGTVTTITRAVPAGESGGTVDSGSGADGHGHGHDDSTPTWGPTFTPPPVEDGEARKVIASFAPALANYPGTAKLGPWLRSMAPYTDRSLILILSNSFGRYVGYRDGDSSSGARIVSVDRLWAVGGNAMYRVKLQWSLSQLNQPSQPGRVSFDLQLSTLTTNVVNVLDAIRTPADGAVRSPLPSGFAGD